MSSEYTIEQAHPVIPGLTASRRKLIQGLAPVIALLATAYGVTTDNTAVLWVNLVLAVVSAGVALPNVRSASPLKKWLYGLVPAVAALAVGFGVVDGATVTMWITFATVALSGGVAFPATTDDVIDTTGEEVTGGPAALR